MKTFRLTSGTEPSCDGGSLRTGRQISLLWPALDIREDRPVTLYIFLIAPLISRLAPT